MADSELYEKASNTPEPYRFKLFNPDTNQEITLTEPPVEWKSGTIQVERDINIGGIFTSFVVSSLTFVKEGAKFLNDIWEEKEMNGKCDLIVEYYKFPDSVYVEMPNRFSLKFSVAKPRVKVGSQAIGFLVETGKDDILVKLENRRDKEIDITKTVSIGGYEIVDYQELKKDLYFSNTYLKFQTLWIANYTNSGRVQNNEDYHVYTTFDMVFNANDFSETNELSYQTNLQSVSNVNSFFSNSLEDRELIFYYFFGIEVTNRKGGFLNPQNVYATFVEVSEGGEVILSERIQDIGRDKGLFYAEGSVNISLKAGQSIKLFIRTDDTSGIDAYIRTSQFRLVQDVVQYPTRTVESFPIYESFERILQHITDTQFPFYSEFLGREDVIYNLNGDKYASEDQLRFANILSGLNLRGAKLFDNDNPLAISFDDLFLTGDSLYSLGYELENIDGFDRIRIENYSYFFDDVEILDLSDRLTIYDIESEAMPGLAYSQVKSGFKDYSYERFNGRGEFNTESSRTSVVNTETTYEIVSPVRADTMGISEKIAQPLDTEDSEEDNSLFIIKTQKSGESWQPERQENITVEENTSLFDSDSFNLLFTPTRNLIRHGERIKGAFLKYLSTYFRFQKSNKLQTLKTTGEGYTVTENDDILVDFLPNPIFKPMKHIVTCKFTKQDFEQFMSNPKGYLTYTTDIKGYALSLKMANNEDKATIEIIEKA